MNGTYRCSWSPTLAAKSRRGDTRRGWAPSLRGLLQMSYAVKEIFYTLQGEGAQAGRAAVFCRFAGCNLWSGREADRAAAVCRFCDTEFVGVDGPGGGKFESAEALAKAIEQKWPGDASAGKRFVVCTGGEPFLQLDASLIEALHSCDLRLPWRPMGRLRLQRAWIGCA